MRLIIPKNALETPNLSVAANFYLRDEPDDEEEEDDDGGEDEDDDGDEEDGDGYSE